MLQMSPRVDLDGAQPKISSGSITWSPCGVVRVG